MTEKVYEIRVAGETVARVVSSPRHPPNGEPFWIEAADGTEVVVRLQATVDRAKAERFGVRFGVLHHE